MSRAASSDTNASFSIDQLRAAISQPIAVHGADRAFQTFRPVTDAYSDSLTFISAGRADGSQLAASTKAAVIICTEQCLPNITEQCLPNASPSSFKEKTFVVVSDPKLAFIQAVKALNQHATSGSIHPTAVIHSEAVVHPTASIGPLTYVGRAQIGQGSVIDGNCFIYDQVKIGKDCHISAGCVIGADGFGHVVNEAGDWENFPHLAGVTIEDDVELAPNCCIARGALSDTIVRRGAKIDCLTQIGHNCQIGEKSLILAQSVIGGSTSVGPSTVVSIGSSVADYVKIGERSFLGIGSTVISSLPADSRVAARPSLPLPAQTPKRD